MSGLAEENWTRTVNLVLSSGLELKGRRGLKLKAWS